MTVNVRSSRASGSGMGLSSALRDSQKWQINGNYLTLSARLARISLRQCYLRRDHSVFIIACLKLRPHAISQVYALLDLSPSPASLSLSLGTLTKAIDISHEPVTTVTRERSIHLPVCDIPRESRGERSTERTLRIFPSPANETLEFTYADFSPLRLFAL